MLLQAWKVLLLALGFEKYTYLRLYSLDNPGVETSLSHHSRYLYIRICVCVCVCV